MYDQTLYALEFAAKAYEFYVNFFGTPEIVPKAGVSLLYLATISFLCINGHGNVFDTDEHG